MTETIRNGDLQVDLAAQLGAERLPAEVETTLYRIVQEALTNVVKHAEATRVSILLVRKPGSVAAVVEDNGRGLGSAGDGEEGIGMLGMKERLDLVDGRLVVESTEGSGTTVVAEVPAITENRTRVFVVDDHAVVRSGLKLLLAREDDFEVVGEAASATEAAARVGAIRPDVVLLDVTMPGETGIEALPRIRDAAPETKVLVLSMHDDPSYVREAFAGAQRVTSSRKRPTASSSRRCARSPTAATTSTPSSARAWLRPTPRRAARPSPTR